MTQEILDNGKDKSKGGAKGEEKIPQLNTTSVEKINKGMKGGEKKQDIVNPLAAAIVETIGGANGPAGDGETKKIDTSVKYEAMIVNKKIVVHRKKLIEQAVITILAYRNAKETAKKLAASKAELSQTTTRRHHPTFKIPCPVTRRRKMAQQKEGMGSWKCPKPKCARQCTSAHSLGKHLSKHADSLYPKHVDKGFRCSNCPKAYLATTKRWDRNSHILEGKGCHGATFLEGQTSFYWLGTAGNNTLYGVRTDGEEKRGTPYVSGFTRKAPAKKGAPAETKKKEEKKEKIDKIELTK